jgi:aminodeoxyfutalosine deaminase
MLQHMLYTADAVSNGVGLPVEDGAVVVSVVAQADASNLTTVVAFGKAAELQAMYPEARVQHLGRAILPRPANAHTHLDLSLVPFRALPYFRWIPEVVLAGRGLRGLAAAQAGAAQLAASGVQTIGDIVARSEVMDWLLTAQDRHGLSGVAYWEVLAPDPAQAEVVFGETVARLTAWRKLERPGGLRVGLSPHTPFTVSGVLLQKLAAYSEAEAIPLQIHVAEHPAELELFQTGGGALADSLARMGVPDPSQVWGREPSPTLTPVRHLHDLGVLRAKPTLIHAVNVTEHDVALIAEAACVVVNCPRSNHNLECGLFPWSLFARYGVEVALGTDSTASGQTLDLRDEALAALALHQGLVSWRTLVRAASKGGFRALGQKPPLVARGDDWQKLLVWP